MTILNPSCDHTHERLCQDRLLGLKEPVIFPCLGPNMECLDLMARPSVEGVRRIRMVQDLAALSAVGGRFLADAMIWVSSYTGVDRR